MSFIEIKKNQDLNYYYLCIWYSGIWGWAGVDGYIGIHHEIIYDLNNGSTGIICRMHDPAWHHQDETQYLSTSPDHRNDSKFNDETKSLVTLNTPGTQYKGIVHRK